MGTTVTSLQADVDRLNQAITDGVRSVSVGGQTVLFNTSQSLIAARDDAVLRLNALKAGQSPRRVPTRTYLYYAGRGNNC